MTTRKSKKTITAFKRVILYVRHHRANQGVGETLTRLIAFLATQPVEVFLDEETAASFASVPFMMDATCQQIPVLPRQAMCETSDLMIVVGGDGSLLSAARLAVHANVPVIGINRGRLGFLTDISPHDLESELQPVLAGCFFEEKRFLLQMQVSSGRRVVFKGHALNDVVLSRNQQMQLIVFDVYIDQQFVSHYRSDGLILATPTGSTAYALSAGGPIMHPQMDAIVMVPMFSHSLSSRPLVIDGQSSIELRISAANESALLVSCDGHESHSVHPGQCIKIKKHRRPIRLLHPMNYRYYETLRLKLGWGSQAKRSENE